MPIHEKKINQRIVTASFVEPELQDLIKKHVARLAGIDLDENGVTATVFIAQSFLDGKGNIHTAKCEIIQDLDAPPRYSPTNDAGK